MNTFVKDATSEVAEKVATAIDFGWRSASSAAISELFLAPALAAEGGSSRLNYCEPASSANC